MPNEIQIDDEEEINLRGEGVHEILSYVPNKVIRYGNVVLVCIVAVLILGSWFVKYPEIINSTVTVSGQIPTVQFIAQSSGKITLFVENNSDVVEGQDLAMIENSANLGDVRFLANMLKAQEHNLELSNDSVVLDLDRPLLLGELQNDFSQLKQQYKNYRAFRQEDYYPKKIMAYAGQFRYYLNLNNKLVGQKNLLNRELELASAKYRRDQKLMDSKVISQVELEKSEADYLQKEYNYKNTEINLMNNEIQLREYEKTMFDLEQQYKDLKRENSIAFQESFKKMQSAIGAWEQRYMVRATIKGTVSLFKFFNSNQFVTAGEEIMSLVPKSNKLLARCYVPLYGSGKVKEGQRVNIKLDGFPFREFGMLEGKVESISLSPRNNFYLVEVSLTNGLVTTYKKKLELKNEMTGTAEIITEDLRLLERLFYQVRSVIK